MKNTLIIEAVESK